MSPSVAPVRRSGSTARHSARSRDSELPAIGLAATLFIGAQSLVDFGVQIPAVAFTYSALAGIGWAQSFSSRSG